MQWSNVSPLPSLAEPPLPNVAVQHWVLPKSQLKMELGLEDFLRAPVGNTLVFVRAVTIALDHPPEEIELVGVYTCTVEPLVMTAFV